VDSIWAAAVSETARLNNGMETDGSMKDGDGRLDNDGDRPRESERSNNGMVMEMETDDYKVEKHFSESRSFLCVSLTEGNKKPSLQRVDSVTKRPLWGKTI
jgi:hypothetical protein